MDEEVAMYPYLRAEIGVLSYFLAKTKVIVDGGQAL